MEIINMDDQEMSKYHLGTVSMKTWISTVISVLLIVNQIATASGVDTPIVKLMGNLSEDTTSEIARFIGVSTFLIGCQAYTWWHNNSITKKAQAADKKFGLLKKGMTPETTTLIPVTIIVDGVATTVYSDHTLQNNVFVANPIPEAPPTPEPQIN